MNLSVLLLQIDSLRVNPANTKDFNTLLYITLFILIVLAIGLLVWNSFKKGASIDHQRHAESSLRPDKLSTQESPSKDPPVHKEQNRRSLEELHGSVVANPESAKVHSIQKTLLQNEQRQPRRISFVPNTKYVQEEPFHFPYVLMPVEDCVVIGGRRGAAARQGRTDAMFAAQVIRYFGETATVETDQALTVNGVHYTPDISLIHDPKGKRILVDLEVDEPYEGTNDLLNRKPTHFCGADSARNRAFIRRGWIVVRFAEVQVHQEPIACCRFLAEVLASVDKDYKVPAELLHQPQLHPLKQWTKVEAQIMSRSCYREQYLGISRFGVTAEGAAELEAQSDEDKLGEAHLGTDAGETLIETEQVKPEPRKTEVKSEINLPPTISPNGQPTKKEQLPPPAQPRPLPIAPTRRQTEVQPPYPLPVNPRTVRPPSTDTLSVIRWAIEQKKYLYFVDSSFGNTIIDAFQPTYITNEIVTGYWHKEKRYTQRPIRFIKDLIVKESTV